MMKLVASCALAFLLLATVAAQTPIDTSKIGPQVGSVAPPFSGSDQNGAVRTLASAAGRKGTMLVFFRSSDW
jgi:hypothetical protein